MSSKPKQTRQQKELERLSIERERQLRVENAKQTTKAFSDNIAFRKKLRGIFSLLSGGFQGFPNLGSGGGRAGGGGSGISGGGGGTAGGTIIPGTGGGSGAGGTGPGRPGPGRTPRGGRAGGQRR